MTAGQGDVLCQQQGMHQERVQGPGKGATWGTSCSGCWIDITIQEPFPNCLKDHANCFVMPADVKRFQGIERMPAWQWREWDPQSRT